MAALARWWRTSVRGTPRARDVSDAVLTLAVGLALIAVGLVGLWSGPVADDAGRWWAALPLLAICAVMLGKRRRPVLTLAVGVVIVAVDAGLGGSLGTMVALIDLIHATALYAGAAAVRRIESAVAVVAIGTPTVVFVVTGQVQSAVSAALTLVAVLVTPLWWGRSVRQQAELAQLASARAADLERLSALREAEVVHEERTRMARDLHDALAGNLSAIAIHTEAALTAPGAGDGSRDHASTSPERRALEAIRAASVSSLEEMRAMILLLRSGDDEVRSPARLSELDDLVATARAGGLSVQVRLPDVPPLPSAVDQAAYRIVQESLTNASRHARGGDVELVVDVDGAALRLQVTSTGGSGTARRPDPGGTGIGLLTMRERAEALGGTFEAGWVAGADPGSRDHQLWRVRATLPIEETR
ncbi:sensor histidine kinase [Georgenia subflava]|uniref:histidine kinase n=1 Tax=Georgenia subflava TaxID=1622177 RepID=A0A6N7EN24_9MICO|nr:histidine kinase [Georgenia subflava]MPV36614.1 two-component sensor histidine kinase [Georgenia subflava]